MNEKYHPFSINGRSHKQSIFFLYSSELQKSRKRSTTNFLNLSLSECIKQSKVSSIGLNVLKCFVLLWLWCMLSRSLSLSLCYCWSTTFIRFFLMSSGSIKLLAFIGSLCVINLLQPIAHYFHIKTVYMSDDDTRKIFIWKLYWPLAFSWRFQSSDDWRKLLQINLVSFLLGIFLAI